MGDRSGQTAGLSALRGLLAGVLILFLYGFAGYTEVQYQASSPKGTYDARITIHAGPSEKYSWWSMDVTREGVPVLSDYFLSPFYAWTCVQRGTGGWASDSVLHFANLSCQGRKMATLISNETDETVSKVELWVRSVDSNGYPHSASLILAFDVPPKEHLRVYPEVFPGAEYLFLRCESGGEEAIARFRVPRAQGAPHDISFGRGHRVTVTIAGEAPVIDGGGLDAISEQQALELVPGGVRLHLVEHGRDPRPGTQEQNKTSPADR